MPRFDFLRRHKSPTSAVSSMPDQQAVLQALTAFIDAPSDEEKRSILERDQHLLLNPSGAALAWLDALINSAQKSEDPQRLATVGHLAFHRALLQRADTLGIPAAWAELESVRAQVMAPNSTNSGEATAGPGVSPVAAVSLSAEEGERAAFDSEYLRTVLGLTADDPQVMFVQTELRQSLARQRVHSAIAAPVVGGDDSAYRETLGNWLVITSSQERRSSLETHLELVDGRAETILSRAFALFEAEPAVPPPLQAEVLECLREARYVLRRARLGGATIQTVRAASVDAFGARCLDLPPWLVQAWTRWETLHFVERAEQTRAAQVSLLQEALVHAEGEASLPEVVTADLRHQLAQVLIESQNQQGPETLEPAIQLCEAALREFTHEAYPRQWGMLEFDLGSAYRQRTYSDYAGSLEEAIVHLQRALEVLTREDFPSQWALVQNNLGLVYSERIRGDAAANLDQAIGFFDAALTVHTRADAPIEWARLQANLGSAYLKRGGDDRAKNLAQATAAYEAALQVYTHESFPVQWANIANNLGIIYAQRGTADDIEQAIKYLQDALQVRTREASPLDWAMTETNLGLAYKNRVQGDHGENVEHAIACFTEVLDIIARGAFPDTWAGIQNNVGQAYRERVVGERADNLRRAIAAYDAALQVWTPEASPARHRQAADNRSEVEALLKQL